MGTCALASNITFPNHDSATRQSSFVRHGSPRALLSITGQSLYSLFFRIPIRDGTVITAQQWTEIARGTGIETEGLSRQKVSQYRQKQGPLLLAVRVVFAASNAPNRDDRFSNTYRPRSPRPRSPPRGDTYRAGRSPPPRRGSPPRRGLASADTYTPGGRSSRPRSRSPAFRRRSRSPRRDDNWRARPRSPPRRNFSPRRDDFRGDRARSPRRDAYDSYTRSPRPRERSPPPREREASPARSRGVRSPVRPSRYDEPRSRVNRCAVTSLLS